MTSSIWADPFLTKVVPKLKLKPPHHNSSRLLDGPQALRMECGAFTAAIANATSHQADKDVRPF
jgi:hypothetical protein